MERSEIAMRAEIQKLGVTSIDGTTPLSDCLAQLLSAFEDLQSHVTASRSKWDKTMSNLNELSEQLQGMKPTEEVKCSEQEPSPEAALRDSCPQVEEMQAMITEALEQWGRKEEVMGSMKELKKDDRKTGVLNPLLSVRVGKRTDVKLFYSIYTLRITEMEKENKELRAKCVEGAEVTKEAAELRVKMEEKEKELAAMAEELSVANEKEARQRVVLEMVEKELKEQLQRLAELKRQAEANQTRMAEMEVGL